MSLGRLYYFFKRDLKRGLGATWHDYVTSKKILQKSFKSEKVPEAIPVHLLCGEPTLLMACWMLASWITQTKRSWKIVVHDDGSLTSESQQTLEALFDHVIIIWRKDADEKMQDVLKDCPHCWDYRSKHPLGLKSFDIPHYVEEERYLMLDSDVMFFKKPQELLDWVDDFGNDECWFNQDALEPAPYTVSETEEKFGITLWPKINSGLCAFHKDIADYDFFEKCLKDEVLQSCKQWRVEQTLLGLSASRRNKGGLLPKTYEVSLGDWMETDVIARHYVGVVRQRYYAEAIAKVHKTILA